MLPETTETLIVALSEKFCEAGIASARLDARLLVLHATGLTHERLIAEPDRLLNAQQQSLIAQMAQRRQRREPVSRIIGEREFYGRRFAINEHTLDPRPDTETLVDAALKVVGVMRKASERLAIADLGTGSGVIVVTLLAELPEDLGIGTDISAGALAMAHENARRHKVAGRLRLLKASWTGGLQERFDLIVANPPYLKTGDIIGLAPEVRLFDPWTALDGGGDGLDAFRQIACLAVDYLRIGGHLSVEIGSGQVDEVMQIMLASGLRAASAVAAISSDLSGIPRVLTLARV